MLQERAPEPRSRGYLIAAIVCAATVVILLILAWTEYSDRKQRFDTELEWVRSFIARDDPEGAQRAFRNVQPGLPVSSILAIVFAVLSACAAFEALAKRADRFDGFRFGVHFVFGCGLGALMCLLGSCVATGDSLDVWAIAILILAMGLTAGIVGDLFWKRILLPFCYWVFFGDVPE